MPKEKLEIIRFLTKRFFLLVFVTCSLILTSSTYYIYFFQSIGEHGSYINLAGRQRMLSQKIAKLSLQCFSNPQNSEFKKTLAETVSLWKTSHENLQNKVKTLQITEEEETILQSYFQAIQSYHDSMVSNATLLQSGDNSQKALDTILEKEGPFLVGMNKLVFYVQELYDQKFQFLKKLEIGISTILILSLILFGYLVAVPTKKTIESSLNEIEEKQLKIRNLAEELKLRNDSLYQSLQNTEKALGVRAAFLAMMSHEIRTPMNGILAMSEILLNQELTDPIREEVQVIRKSGETLLSILNNILDYSKIESGKLELESIPFDIRELVEETIDIVSPKAMEKDLDFHLFIDPTIPNHFLGDPIRIRQILLNLISNAIKFTPSGEVGVHVTKLSEKANEELLIQFLIKDTGIGITKQKLDKLFQPFTQLDSSTTREYGGSGLGLVITKTLVSLLNGNISVESIEKVGSNFTFAIKLKPSTTQNISRNFPQNLEGKTIFILEDSPTNSFILKSYLENWGANPIFFTQETEFLSHLENGNIADLLISRTNMRNINIEKVLTRVRELEFSFPILLYSSNGHKKVKHTNLILTKPIKEKKLYDAILELLGLSPKTETSKEKKVDLTNKDFASLRILTAEDNSVNQKVFQKVLTSLGAKSEFVTNGLEAMEQLQKKEYDIVFMDINMPGLDGYETTKQIRKGLSKNSQTYIVAITANAFFGDEQKCFEAGMNAYVPKPISVLNVQESIESYLQWKASKTTT